MFTLSRKEIELFDALKKLSGDLLRARTAFRNALTHDPQYEDHKNTVNVLQKEYDELIASNDVKVIRIKKELNQTLNNQMGGITPDIAISLLENITEQLATDQAIRASTIVKTFTIKALECLADKDVHDAFAKVTATRYNSLIAAGLPADVVANIIVAEASRPLPWFKK